MARHPTELSAQTDLAHVLGCFLDKVGWSERQLAQRAQIPRGTIRNWMKGAVTRPRKWHPLIQAAAVMRLNTAETDELLNAAHYPSISDLWVKSESELDKRLLSQFLADNSNAVQSRVFQAMPELPYFVGRKKELKTLKEHLLKNNHPTIYVLSGMAGVGKTTLATRLAYEVRDYFTDGILWARADTGDPMSLLKLLADSFGQDVSHYADLHSRSQAVRGILAFKNALLVLDNVDNSGQAQYLLPPTGPCAVLITTRQNNLRIARSCPQIYLEPFAQTEQTSHALFCKILGNDNAETEREALTKIAELLGHLPLALAIVAGRIALEPDTTAQSYLARLQAEKAKLDALTHEEQSVRASFNSSFAALTANEQAYFAALGVFGGEDFSFKAATAVTQTSDPTSLSHLTQLHSLSLIQAGKNQRYLLHPLLRDYARAQNSNQAVRENMVTYFAQYVKQNQDNFKAIQQELDNILTALDLAFDNGMTATGIKFTLDMAQFLTMNGLRSLVKTQLDRAERAAENLQDIGSLALIKCAQGHTEKGRIWHQAQSYFEEGVKLAHKSADEKIIALTLKEAGVFYYARGDYQKAHAHWEQSLELARKVELHKLLLFLFNHLAGIAINYFNDYHQAENLFLEGLDLQRKHQNLAAMSLQFMNLCMIAFSLGAYKQAENYLKESESIAEEINYPLVKIILSRHKANLLIAQQGDFEQARLNLRRGLKLARDLQDAAATGFILAGLGKVNARLHNFGEAVENLQEALLTAIETRRQDIEIEVLTCLGYVAAERNQPKLATSHFEKALLLARSYNDTWYLGQVLNEFGKFCLTQEMGVQSEITFQELLTIGQRSEFLALMAKALFGLAKASLVRGDIAKAQELGQQSLSIFTEIGHFQGKITRKWLAEIPFSFFKPQMGFKGNEKRPLT